MKPTRILVLAALVAAVLPLGAAQAAVPAADIASAGPLQNVYVGNELSCQVRRGGGLQVYPSSLAPADCGTFVAYDGALHAPAFSAHGGSATGSLGATTPFTPVSQSPVAGMGTPDAPYRVETVVTAGPALRITQTDSYVAGDDFWTVAIRVENLSAERVEAELYRGQDCYLGASDSGFGFRDAAHGGVGCAANPDNTPAGNVEGLIPAAGQGVHGLQAAFNVVWQAIGARAPLADSCACASSHDNGVAVNWHLSLAPGGATRVTVLHVFSATGSVPPPPPTTWPVVATPPSLELSSPPVVGAPITGGPATFTDATATTDQWQRCDTAAPASCTDIPGATTATYTPAPADEGDHLRVVTTATNGDGQTSAASPITETVRPPAPAGSAIPVPGGSAAAAPAVGTPVSAATGDWAGAETTSVQFQRCATEDPASCVDIPGATSPGYTPVPEDAGHHLRVVVTATGPGGTTRSVSPMTGKVEAADGELPAEQPTPPGDEGAPDGGTGDPESKDKAAKGGAIKRRPGGRCVTRRSVTMHWRVRRRVVLTNITVAVNGRPFATLNGGDREVTVPLRGHNSRKLTIRVVGTTTTGRLLATTRVYRTCRARSAGDARRALELRPVRRR